MTFTRTWLILLPLLLSSYGLQSGCSRTDAQSNAKTTSEKSQAKDAPMPAPTQTAPMTGAVGDAARVGEAFAQVAERVSNSVVSIHVESKQARPQNPFSFFFGQPDNGPDYNIVKGGGSGFIISPEGAIVTNNHVVDKATRIEVVLQDKRRFKGKVLGTDPATDLAVVKIDAKDLPAVRFADSSRARVGEWVIAIGSPFGLDYTVTAGVLSAMGRGGFGANEIEDYLQTDASINPGNSGGPLVNLRGEVLGINTMIIGRGTGIGFAIPSNLAMVVVRQLQTKGSVKRAWIGVMFQELTSELAEKLGVKQRGGALIGNVVPNGPSARAGLKPGDVIVSIDGKPVREGHDLLRAIIEKPVGSKVELGIIRDGKEVKATVTTAERPGDLNEKRKSGWNNEPDEAGGYGLQVEPMTQAWAQRLGVRVHAGLVVTRVSDGSPADRNGLRAGDVIVEADRRPVTKTDDLVAALKDGSALLRIERKDGAFFTVLSKSE